MIRLGDRVRDRISGFEGIVIGITDWLYQCRRPIVQPSGLDKDGAVMKTESFDEEQLEVVEAGAFALKVEQVVEPEAKTGGPRDTPARRSDPSRR
jgi:hypothetical protein